MSDRFTRTIFIKMWLPAIISSLGWALSDVADAIVVGQQQSSMGLAALSLCLPVYMVNCVFAHGLGVGGSVRYARLLGEGRAKEAAESFNMVIQVALGLSVLTAVLGNVFLEDILRLMGVKKGNAALYAATEKYLRVMLCAAPVYYLSNLLNYYLRSDEGGKRAGIGSVAGNLSDIGLNIFLVLGMGLGTQGAALSTAAGHVVAVAVYLPALIAKENILTFARVKPSLIHAFTTFAEGFSSSAQYLCSLVFLLFSNNYLIRSGDANVAVLNLAQSAMFFILYMYDGTVRAMQPLVSTYYGERREEGMKQALKLSFGFGCAAGLTVAALMAVFAAPVCALVGLRVPGVVRIGVFALRLVCVASVFGGVSILMAGYCQACGRERESLLITLFRGYVVLLPCAVFFAVATKGLFWLTFPVVEAAALGLWAVFGRSVCSRESYRENRVWHGVIRSLNEDIDGLNAQAAAFVEGFGANTSQVFYINMAIEEICLVIMQFGFEKTREPFIEITLVAEESGSFTLRVRDNAMKFNPFSLETKKANEGGDFDMDAMGMTVIKKKAKRFFYRQYGGFNTMAAEI